MKFKFELNQLVEPRISDEWGEVRGRAAQDFDRNVLAFGPRLR